jgi:hypothetical protein
MDNWNRGASSGASAVAFSGFVICCWIRATNFPHLTKVKRQLFIQLSIKIFTLQLIRQDELWHLNRHHIRANAPRLAKKSIVYSAIPTTELTFLG